jgi:hypothetical protein
MPLLIGMTLATSRDAIAQGMPGYLNVNDFRAAGAPPDDFTHAINRALDTIRFDPNRRGGVLYFPPGIYDTMGDHNVIIDGLSIVGAGTGATTIRITHPTNDLFFIINTASNQTYRDFSVRSGTTRTDGWVLRVRANADPFFGGLKESRILDLDINEQRNGIWLAQFSSVWIDRVQMKNFSAFGGTGLKAGQRSPSVPQGSNLYVQGTEIYGIPRPGLATLATPRPDYAFVIEDANSIFMADNGTGAIQVSALKIISNGGSVFNLNFKQCVLDATVLGPSAHITGPGVALEIAFDGSWFASAGNAFASEPGNPPALFNDRPPAVLIDVATAEKIQFTGGRFVNAKGSGIAIAPSNPNGNGSVLLTGVGVRSGNDQTSGISAAVPVNALGPVISGVDETGQSNTFGLGTVANTTNRMVVVGSRFVNRVSVGINPNGNGGVAANNDAR